MKLYQSRAGGSHVFAVQHNGDIRFDEQGLTDDAPGLAIRNPAEMPSVSYNDGRGMVYVRFGDWLVYPALTRAEGYVVKPYGHHPWFIKSDEEFREMYIACDGKDDESTFRSMIAKHINRYIKDVRLRDEDDALAPFEGRKDTVLTKEDIGNAIQYLEKLRHVIQVRDFVEGK